MAKLNISRGLLQLGDSLGQVAQSVAQRERDAMMMAREENLMRLQSQLRQQADDRQFGQQKELIGIEDDLRGKAEGRRQGFETAQAGDRRAHEETMFGKEASLRREVMGREEALTEKRWTREDLNTLERHYAAQIGAVDERLSKINDELTKQQAKASTAGVELDPKLLQPWQEEITQLQQQKKLLGQERDMALTQAGSKRHRKLTPEEVDEARRLAAGRNEPGGRQSPKPQLPASAAQAPPSDDIPPLPAKPQGMIDREQRKQTKGDGALSRMARRVADELSPEAGREAREREAQRFRGLGKKITGAFDGTKRETAAANDAKKKLRAGESLSPEARAQVRGIGRNTLKRMYGYTDRELAQLGL